jgi:RNA polymerase sigma-70 factor, ECF subfamily
MSTIEHPMGRLAEFGKAYAELRPSAVRVAFRVLGDAAAAEDVVQEAFMHLWQRPSAYDPRRGSLRTYMLMLVRSRAVDRWRSTAAHRAAAERTAGEARHLPGDAEDSIEHVLRRDSGRRAIAAVRTLPREQRRAVLLASMGLSASEIAEHEGLPLGTAKSRIRLGLEKARARLEDAA